MPAPAPADGAIGSFRLHRRERRAPRGFTLTEIAIVLGVIGIILGAIWSAYGLVAQHFKVNQLLRDIMITEQNLRILFPSGPGAVPNWSDLTATALAAGAFPPEMVTPAGVVDPWGNGIDLVANAEDSQPFLLALGNMTNSTCMQFATKMIAMAPNNSLYSIMIDGNGWGTNQHTTPWTLNQITLACNSIYQNNNIGGNFLQFTFGL